jgi:hypothetical protein
MDDLHKSLELPVLPEHVIEEILVWLPVESLCRFRSVSRNCNALLSSTKFIRSKWAEKPPNRNTWLLVQDVGKSPLDCLAYSFSTRTWRNTSCISFPFFAEEKVKFVTFYGSGAGLFLHTIYPSPCPFVVSNPLTRTSLKLTAISSITIFSVGGIVEGEGDNRGTYKVVVVGEDSHEAGIVEIYDSTYKSWRIAGHLPHDVHIDKHDMVFCAGSFYCFADIHDQSGIMGFSIEDGTSIFAPLPEIADSDCMSPYLLTCGSWVLVAGYIFGQTEELLQVIVWGLEKEKVNSSSSTSSSSSWWKEITRMPPSLSEDFKRISIHCNKWCIGVGDCTCFIVSGHRNRKFRKVAEVVVYSVTENAWSWLPSRPLDTTSSTSEGYELVMAFEPRLDMKVG